MRALENRIIRPLLNAMDRYPTGWVYIGVLALAIAYVVLITTTEIWAGGAL